MEPVPTPFLGNRVYPETDMLSVLEKKTVPFAMGEEYLPLWPLSRFYFRKRLFYLS